MKKSYYTVWKATKRELNDEGKKSGKVYFFLGVGLKTQGKTGKGSSSLHSIEIFSPNPNNVPWCSFLPDTPNEQVKMFIEPDFKPITIYDLKGVSQVKSKEELIDFLIQLKAPTSLINDIIEKY